MVFSGSFFFFLLKKKILRFVRIANVHLNHVTIEL